MTYEQLVEFREQYNATDRDVVAANIRSLRKKHKLKHKALADIMGVSVHTVYAYTKVSGYTVKPDTYILLLFAAYLDISPFDLLKDVR